MKDNIRNAAISRLILLGYNPATAPAIVDAVLEILSKVTPQEITDFTISNGDLLLNTALKQVFFRGKEIKMSATEYRLLECLARNAGRILSYQDTFNSVWGMSTVDVSYLRVYVRSIRK